MWFRCRIQPVFRLFFFIIQFSFVQNSLLLSKVSEQRKSFSISFCSGGSKTAILSLTGGGRHKTLPGKEAMDAVGKDDSLSLRSIFTMKRRRFITVSGVVLIVLPTPGTSKIGAEEGCTGEEPQRGSSSEPESRLKAAPDAISGCMPDADMHSVGSFKSLAGQGFSDNDAVNVVPIYF